MTLHVLATHQIMVGRLCVHVNISNPLLSRIWWISSPIGNLTLSRITELTPKIRVDNRVAIKTPAYFEMAWVLLTCTRQYSAAHRHTLTRLSQSGDGWLGTNLTSV